MAADISGIGHAEMCRQFRLHQEAMTIGRQHTGEDTRAESAFWKEHYAAANDDDEPQPLTEDGDRGR